MNQTAWLPCCKMIDRYKAHQDLIKRFNLLATKTLPEFRLFARHVGKFLTPRGTPISINSKGMCDQYGIFTLPLFDFHIPIHFEIEYKTGNAKLTIEQREWRGFCITRTIPHIVIRDENQGVKDIKKVIYDLKKKIDTAYYRHHYQLN